MRVATAADWSGSAHTSAVRRPGATVTPLVSSTSSAPGAGIAARTGVVPVAGSVDRTRMILRDAITARVRNWTDSVMFCSGHVRNAAYP